MVKNRALLGWEAAPLSQRYIPVYTTTITTSYIHPSHNPPAHNKSLEMATTQHNNFHQSASQNMDNQQRSANNGTVYNFYLPAQMPAAPFPVYNNGAQGQHRAPLFQQAGTEDLSLAPGFAHQGFGFGKPQPHLGGTSGVQSRMLHVCACERDLATEGEKRILRTLCNSVRERSGKERDCSAVGSSVVRKCVDLCAAGRQEQAEREFWRRAQKNWSQRAIRGAEKQQKARAKRPLLDQGWLDGVMALEDQLVAGNAGEVEPNVYLNGTPPDNDAGVHMQMQEQAPQTFSPQEMAQLSLMEMGPQTFAGNVDRLGS